MKYLIIEVTPYNLKCVSVCTDENEATSKVATWNELEKAWAALNGQPDDIQYKVLAIEPSDLISQLEK